MQSEGGGEWTENQTFEELDDSQRITMRFCYTIWYTYTPNIG